MVKHKDRPTKIWAWDNGDKEPPVGDEDGYGAVVKGMWSCEAWGKDMKALKAWSIKKATNPSICHECAIRLGLEW